MRNPLGVISNAVYFLKLTQPDAPAKTKEYLDLIQKNVGISERIIGDLREFAQPTPLQPASVSLAESVNEALSKFPPQDTVQVTLDLPDDLPMAYADPRQAVQILGNLILNACQAMPHGGTLTISSRAQADKVCVSMRDTGVGIPPENMEKLFEPLFTTKPQGIGLGLGLSICKLVEANGGRIEVESEVGKGSTFSVWLPAAEEKFDP